MDQSSGHSFDRGELQRTIDSVPAAVWSAKADASVDFLNRHYLDYIGLPLSEALGWGWTQVIHPDDLPNLLRTWETLSEQGQPGETEARIRRHDGEYRWFLFRANPRYDESGRVIKWYGFNTDIEDRRKMEGELRRSEAFLVEGQHLAQMGNFFWRLRTGEIAWSEPLYRIYEFEPGSPVTLDRIGSQVAPENLHQLLDMVARAERGESQFEYHHRMVLPDGRSKYLRLIAHRAQNNGDGIEYVGAVLDITQQREAEEALEAVRSELAKVTRVMSLGALTASIAHEVNQPLTGIITNAGTCVRLLSTDPPSVEPAKEIADRTLRDGNRAAEIISRLQSLFKNEPGKREPLDLNEAVGEVLTLMAGDLRRSRAVVQTDLVDQLPSVSGDRIQLQQVMMNLIRNACHAMENVDDRQRRLLICTSKTPDQSVQLSVKDIGVGFGSAEPERVFQAFFTTKSDGMGIGLSVSRSIIESHGGRLRAEANDGPGATFTLTLPCTGGSEAPPQEAAERGRPRALSD